MEQFVTFFNGIVHLHTTLNLSQCVYISVCIHITTITSSSHSVIQEYVSDVYRSLVLTQFRHYSYLHNLGYD